MLVNEKQLIEDLKNQKNWARNHVYKKYSKWLLGVCMRYTKNKYEAEDVLHDSFIKIFTKINQFTGQGPFEAWMRRIVANTSIEYLKSKVKESGFLDIEEMEYNQDTAYEMSMPEMSPSILMSLLQKLPAGYKLIFNMYVFEEMSHKDIAEQLDISEGTSKSQLHKAKLFLKKEIMLRSENIEELKHSNMLQYE